MRPSGKKVMPQGLTKDDVNTVVLSVTPGGAGGATVLGASPLDDEPPHAANDAVKASVHSASLVRQTKRCTLGCIEPFPVTGGTSYRAACE